MRLRNGGVVPVVMKFLRDAGDSNSPHSRPELLSPPHFARNGFGVQWPRVCLSVLSGATGGGGLYYIPELSVSASYAVVRRNSRVGESMRLLPNDRSFRNSFMMKDRHSSLSPNDGQGVVVTLPLSIGEP